MCHFTVFYDTLSQSSAWMNEERKRRHSSGAHIIVQLDFRFFFFKKKAESRSAKISYVAWPNFSVLFILLSRIYCYNCLHIDERRLTFPTILYLIVALQFKWRYDGLMLHSFSFDLQISFSIYFIWFSIGCFPKI